MPKPSTGPGRNSSSNGTRPLGPRPRRVPSEVKSPARRKLETLSAGPLLRMHSLPRLVVPGLLFVLFAAGLFIKSSWAGILLAVVAVFVAWLLAVSWPLLATSAKIIRVLVVAALVAAAVWRLTGNG